jgi:hypothetical protein
VILLTVISVHAGEGSTSDIWFPLGSLCFLSRRLHVFFLLFGSHFSEIFAIDSNEARFSFARRDHPQVHYSFSAQSN